MPPRSGFPLHARGAGTGLAGESLGRGLVIDFSRYMRRIVRVDDDRVRVQPGMVHAVLNQHLAASGRLFGPDPAMSLVTTMGSVVAIDASGSHWLQYGSARRHVQSLQVVLADGTVWEVGREPIPAAGDASPRRRGGKNWLRRSGTICLTEHVASSSPSGGRKRCSIVPAINWPTCWTHGGLHLGGCCPAAKARWR